MVPLKTNSSFGRVTATLTVFFLVLMMHCSLNLVGGSSEIGNGHVVGKIVDSLDNPAASATVTLIPVSYDPVAQESLHKIISGTTDKNGSFLLTIKDPGAYTLQAINDVDRTRAAVWNIHVDPDSTVTLSPAMLRVPGSIKLLMVDTVDRTTGYFFIPGTRLFVRIPAEGGFAVIDSVPAGIVPVIRYEASEGIILSDVRYNLPVLPGSTAQTTNGAWKYARSLYLNTTASGVAISGIVTGFPLLVRLTDLDFDFSQSQADGADIKFTKSNNVELPYEIERWDAVNKHAEVWVRVDTVQVNSNTQFISMYWGASTASTSSGTSAVFDTAQGFQAVWHLGEAGNTLAADATQNGYYGTPSNPAPVSIPGAIGNGLQFDGTVTYLEMPGTATGRLGFPQDGYYSLSAWVYVDLVDTAQTYLLGKGDEQYSFQMTIVPGEYQWGFNEYHGLAGWQITQTVPKTGEWKYLTGVRAGTRQFLYVDGALADSTIQVFTNAGVIQRYTTNNFFIGKTPPMPQESSNFYEGRMDEARVMSRAVNADWIKLCYMNQKAIDQLAVFK